MPAARIGRVAIGVALVATLSAAQAQVPPHQPGTICFTQNFWCWLAYPQYPGSPCACPSPYGRVPGVAN